MGRLFDAVASLLGIRNDVTYEAQAAIEMEVLAKPFVAVAQPYPYSIEDGTVRLKGLLDAIVQDVRAKKSTEIIAARFHKTIANIALDVCKQARETTGLNEVALSGGVWQNEVLLNLVRDGLENQGFRVYCHRQTPTNDGGLALGQANEGRSLILAKAFALARPEGYVRTFLDEGEPMAKLLYQAKLHEIGTGYAAELLAALGQAADGALPPVGSLIEPLTQDMDLFQFGVGLMASVFLLDYALNLTQAALFRKYGFLASFMVRMGYYIIWHIAYGSLIYPLLG